MVFCEISRSYCGLKKHRVHTDSPLFDSLHMYVTINDSGVNDLNIKWEISPGETHREIGILGSLRTRHGNAPRVQRWCVGLMV